MFYMKIQYVYLLHDIDGMFMLEINYTHTNVTINASNFGFFSNTLFIFFLLVVCAS